MSRRSTKTIAINNLRTRSGRRVNERSSRVFESAKIRSVAETVLLYKLVFMTRKAALLSVLMCLCFLSQPFQNVYADEPEATAESAPVEISLPPEVTQIITPNDSSSEVADAVDVSIDTEKVVPELLEEIVSETINETQEVILLAVTSATTTDEKSTVISSSSESVGGSSGGSDIESEETVDPDATDVLVGDESDGSSSDSEIIETPTTTTEKDVIDDNSENNFNTDDESDEMAEGASTTDDVEIPFADNNLISIVESDSVFEFSKNECTRIEDGSFYCQKHDGDTVMDDSLVAAPDADGDLEIYLIRGGVRTQVTYNLVDDASPYYDEYSKTIVWHRLINDRYQIISYDTKSGEEKQLTETGVNNMQPTRHGEYTVWQRWVDNNWEVILYDGTKERQITDSPRHDIAPHVRGPLVIWNSRSNDGTQSLMTYDINDRTYTTIADGDGVSVSNPRMVVMYEAMYENGDIIMKGFDLVSGEIIPLHSLPKQLPDELPGTDSTGETRALIQSKPTTKQVEISNNLGSGGSSTPPILPEPVDGGTLDLRPTTTPETIIDNLPEATSTASIPDLILPVIISTSTAENSATSSQTSSE